MASSTTLADFPYRYKPIQSWPSLSGLARNQNDAKVLRDAATAAGYQGLVLIMNGEANRLLESYRSVVLTARRMAESDPQNARFQLDAASAMLVEGIAVARCARYREAEAILRRSVLLFQQSLKTDPLNWEVPRSLFRAQIWLAETLERQQRGTEALEALREGTRTLETLLARATESTVITQGDLADGYVKLGASLMFLNDIPGATEEMGKATTLLEPLMAKHPHDPAVWYAAAEAYFYLAKLSTARQRLRTAPGPSGRAEACNFYRESAAAWSKIANPGSISSNWLPTLGPNSTKKALTGCGSGASVARSDSYPPLR